MFSVCLILIVKSPGIQIILQKIYFLNHKRFTRLLFKGRVTYKTIYSRFFFSDDFLLHHSGTINNFNRFRRGSRYCNMENLVYSTYIYNHLLENYHLYIKQLYVKKYNLNYFKVLVITNQRSAQ